MQTIFYIIPKCCNTLIITKPKNPNEATDRIPTVTKIKTIKFSNFEFGISFLISSPISFMRLFKSESVWFPSLARSHSCKNVLLKVAAFRRWTLFKLLIAMYQILVKSQDLLSSYPENVPAIYKRKASIVVRNKVAKKDILVTSPSF